MQLASGKDGGGREKPIGQSIDGETLMMILVNMYTSGSLRQWGKMMVQSIHASTLVLIMCMD